MPLEISLQIIVFKFYFVMTIVQHIVDFYVKLLYSIIQSAHKPVCLLYIWVKTASIKVLTNKGLAVTHLSQPTFIPSVKKKILKGKPQII